MRTFPIFFIITFLTSASYAGVTADTTRISVHLHALTKTDKYRNYQNVDQLNSTASYINAVFSKYTDQVEFQEYEVDGQVYKNVICSFGPQEKSRIIVGAHYDVCGDQEGADDNASGVVGLLELARLLEDQKLNHRIDLVAYTLEEPPFFRSEHMGSYVHAKSLADNNVDVFGMVAVEMIGYFVEEEKSQAYPLGALSLFYGNKGDFITLVKRYGAGMFAQEFCRGYKSANTIRTKIFTGPERLQGIDFSDHLNYWKFGYSALMITDTSFYRNRNYHRSTDTVETLDIEKMAKVIDGIFKALTSLQ